MAAKKSPAKNTVKTYNKERERDHAEKQIQPSAGRTGDKEGTATGPAVVGLGASAGGLVAFKAFLKNMKKDSGLAFVFIQHLPPDHKSLMRDLMSKYTDMTVHQMEKAVTLQPNHVYLAPAGKGLTIKGDILQPVKMVSRRGAHMPIDQFFFSLAKSRREKAISVILSGTMADGTQGLKAVKEYGGIVLVQDPDEAEHMGMPTSAINTKVVDFVLPVKKMPETILNYVQHSYVNGDSDKEAEDQDKTGYVLNNILDIILQKKKYDFHHYKKNTVFRRISRRMGLHRVEEIVEYRDFLKDNSEEIDALFKDLLIGVTGFYRDPELWDYLQKSVLSSLLSMDHSEGVIRAWVPGCSTGEEAYTLAMTLLEGIKAANSNLTVQIFATDIDQDGLTIARNGVYPENIAADLAPERLDKFFIKEENTYRVKKELRDAVMFSVHNLISDPPFSNLVLISCRNLFIYLEPEVQKKVVSLFHFSLNDDGYLILGTSEGIGENTHLFQTVSKKWRVYQCVRSTRNKHLNYPFISQQSNYIKESTQPRLKAGTSDMARSIQQIILRDYAPATVVVNRDTEILYLYGPTEEYLNLPEGEPVLKLTEMVKDGLKIKVRSSLQKAVQTNETLEVNNARVRRNNRYYSVHFEVRPVKNRKDLEGLFLVTFQDNFDQKPIPETPADGTEQNDVLVRQLEQELQSTREDLRSTIEELEAANEELKASNEEMMSMNEELQSSNEELETSHEELQSLNEELNTVNSQLQENVVELEESNNDLYNFISSTEVGTLFLDKDLCIRRFTPSVTRQFSLMPGDIGRPIQDLNQRFHDDTLIPDIKEVLKTLLPLEKEIQTADGHWFNRRVYPFRTQDNHIQGAVVTFQDIDQLKKSQLKLKENEEVLSQIFDNINELFFMRDLTSGKIVHLTPEFESIFGITRAEMQKDPSLLADKVHPEDQTDLRKAIDKLRKDHTPFELNFRLQKENTLRWFSISTSLVKDDNDQVQRYVGVISETTSLKTFERDIQRQHELQQTVFETIPDLISVHDRNMNVIVSNWGEKDILPMAMRKSNPFCTECEAGGVKHQCIQCPILHVFETKEPVSNREIHDNHTNIIWEIRAFPIFSENREVDLVVLHAQDITEKEKHAQELKHAQQCFEEALQHSKDIIYRLNMDNMEYDYLSDSCRSILGIPKKKLQEEGMQALLSLVHPDDRTRVKKHMEDVRGNKTDSRTSAISFRITDTNGKEHWLSDHQTFIRDENHASVSIIGIIRDITMQMEIEERLTNSLREKEILLQEVHHRVKNNLQIVTSLLNMSSRRTENEKLISTLTDIRTKIQSMALIHSQLYQRGTFSSMDMAEYIRDLYRQLSSMYDVPKVTPVFNLDKVFLPIDKAIPCGLILNEILTNSFQHGVPRNGKGRIKTTIERHDDDVLIEISDNGKGIPKSMDIETSETLGLKLIRNLVHHQLKGSVKVRNTNGTIYAIRFSSPELDAVEGESLRGILDVSDGFHE